MGSLNLERKTIKECRPRNNNQKLPDSYKTLKVVASKPHPCDDCKTYQAIV